MDKGAHADIPVRTNGHTLLAEWVEHPSKTSVCAARH